MVKTSVREQVREIERDPIASPCTFGISYVWSEESRFVIDKLRVTGVTKNKLRAQRGVYFSELMPRGVY